MPVLIIFCEDPADVTLVRAHDGVELDVAECETVADALLYFAELNADLDASVEVVPADDRPAPDPAIVSGG